MPGAQGNDAPLVGHNEEANNGNYVQLPDGYNNSLSHFVPIVIEQAQLEAAQKIACENAKIWLEETLIPVVNIHNLRAHLSWSVTDDWDEWTEDRDEYFMLMGLTTMKQQDEWMFEQKRRESDPWSLFLEWFLRKVLVDMHSQRKE